ncbi:hypothetical protein [Micromonospora radicis]|nr:hypothetical protein [Micromonospora radicis]
MSVRRQAARLATVCVLLGGLVLLGGAPAHADEDRVRVRSAGSFTAGRSAEGIRLEVRKRTEGCVRVRGALALSLPGVRPDQVVVQAQVGREWVTVPVSGGDGLVTTAPVAPEKDELCEGKGATFRYRVAFGADAPGGRLIVAGEAVTARGVVLGRAAAESRVVGGRVSASPSASPSPSPTPSESAPTVEESAAAPSPTVALADNPGAPVQAVNQSSGGSPVMYFGVAMVAAGVLLIGLLVYRSRKDRGRRGADAPVPAPRSPGGTTYRSAGGPAAAPPVSGDGVPPYAGRGPLPPAAPGQVYGTGRPATPRVYGGPPAARPSGGLYGARPAGVGEPPAQTGAGPAADAPASAPPASVPPTSAPPAAPTSAPPGPPGPPGRAAVPGQPEPPPRTEEGDEPRYGRGLTG